ncbi:N-acetylmuramoyl-L-alanine amidase family protein [Alkalihalobacterium alkalinitrilicum]|uniref:N-acetylmuramoyl-L-alanine amidase family protein n=1 Tax=Alkalihalobacterium alkalinitrilicum TaxID=427920 RepID=UPI001C56D1ED|nr:N-acetylmuramoyl-L-alanine amidase [Alkalihalobacterium alkalinitrilicum]
MIKWMDDPGHGGHDPGAVGNGLKEKDIVMKIALMNRELIKEYEGIEHRLTRDRDTFVSLQDRVKMANDWGADYFTSLHVNAATPSANGYEDFVARVASAKSIANRNVMHDEIRKITSQFTNRGKKTAAFYVIAHTKMPAILTESGFISNPQDAALLKDENFLYKIAQGHVNGVVKIFGLKKKIVVPVSASQAQNQPAVRIQTGGLDSADKIKEISEFLMTKRWWAQLQFENNRNPRITTGGLNPSMRKEFEDWLKERNWWYTIV